MTQQAIQKFKTAKGARRQAIDYLEDRWTAKTRLSDRGFSTSGLRTIVGVTKYGGGTAIDMEPVPRVRPAHEHMVPAKIFGGGRRGSPRGGSVKALETLGRPHSGGLGPGRLNILIDTRDRGIFWFEPAKASPARPDVGVPERDAPIYEAADSLKRAAIKSDPDPALVGQTASLLYRAAHAAADRRPRHAAIALAAWDAIQCTDAPFATEGRRRALWEANRLLLSQFISTAEEVKLLDRMDAAGLERVPPFEDTLVGAIFDEVDGDSVR
jgi:hypothetical protein